MEARKGLNLNNKRDARAWSEEFMWEFDRQFNFEGNTGQTRDEFKKLLITWFGRAIETGIDIGKKELAMANNLIVIKPEDISRPKSRLCPNKYYTGVRCSNPNCLCNI